MQVEVPSCFVGLVLENCELPCANHGHVILGDPSPVLFYPISSTEIRCLVDVPGQKVPSISNGEMAKYLKTVVAPQVPSTRGSTSTNCFLGLAFNYFTLSENRVIFHILS